MTNQEFIKAIEQFHTNFPKLESTVIVVENDGDVLASVYGDDIEIIKAIIDAAMADQRHFSIFLAVGEMLRNTLADPAVEGLNKLHLNDAIEKKLN